MMDNDHPLLKVRLLDLRAKVDRARSMDLKALTDEQVFQRIARLCDGYTKRYDPLFTNLVFRARPQNKGEVFQHVSEVWYPPAEKVSRGRFNAAGEPVLYVSNRPHAAIFEMRPKVGDRFTLLAIHRKDIGQRIQCISVGMSRCQAAEVAVGGAHMNWDKLDMPPKLQARWKLIDQYLGDLSLHPCPDGEADGIYKATNAIARLFDGIPDVDALKYPSVAVDLGAVNFRLTTSKADELFKAGEAWMIEITDHQAEVKGLPPLQTGYFCTRIVARTSPIGPDGKLIWMPFENGDHIPPYFVRPPRF